MARWYTKLITALPLNRNGTTSTGTSSEIVPVPPSPRDGVQETRVIGSAGAPPLHPTLPTASIPQNAPASNVNPARTPLYTPTFSVNLLRLRNKVFQATAQRRTSMTIPSAPLSILPIHPAARHIGAALLVSGLTAAAPLHAVSPLAAAIESATDAVVDLDQAKSALRILAALGDGVAGVPWLKGAAGLGLEIVNTLDVGIHYK